MMIVHRIVGGVLLCAASWSHAYDLQADDDRAATGAVRSTWKLWPAGNRVGGIELGYEYYSGSGNQRLAAGDSQTVEGQTVAAPDVLRHRVSMQRLTLAYVHQFPIGRYVQLEPGVGVAVEQMDWSARSEATGAVLSPRVSTSPVLHVALAARWNFSERFSLEGRASLGQRIPFRFGVGAELALLARAGQNTSFRVGWFSRRQMVSMGGSLFDDSPGDKELTASMQGLSAGLMLNF